MAIKSSTFGRVELSANDAARGKILILDTVKKLTDLMDKKVGSKFMQMAREFVSKGGTLILLAHTNKHRDGAGKGAGFRLEICQPPRGVTDCVARHPLTV